MAFLPWLRLSHSAPAHSIITCIAIQSAPPTDAPNSPPPSLSPSPAPLLACALNCQHFQSCSGCSHELNLHHPIILDEVTDFSKRHGVSGFTFDSCRLWNWRCRSRLVVRGTPTSPLIGLYEEGTHNVVDIPQCEAHHPNINLAVQLLKQGISETNVEPHDEEEGTGDLGYVQMSVTTHNTSFPVAERYNNGKVQVILVWNSRSENSHSAEKLNALARFLWRNGGRSHNSHLIHSIWVNFQASTNNIVFGDRWRHLIGESEFWEHVGGIDIYLAPSSFGQANTQAFDNLLRKLQRYVPYGASVVDFYSEAGVIGLSLAATRKCRSVKCIESNKQAKVSFERSLERLPKSLDCNISWHRADASDDSRSWLVGCDVVVVDPPRKGLDLALVDALCAISTLNPTKVKSSSQSSSNGKVEKRPWILRAREDCVRMESRTAFVESSSLPETLIYISCGWESFKKDCKSLLSNKVWVLEKVHGFNFFPGTQSIEILGVFKRGPGRGLKKKNLNKCKKKTS